MSYNNLFKDVSTFKPVLSTVKLSQNNLPVVQDKSGNSIELNISNIRTFGSGSSQNINKLNNEIISKVKVADSGEMGDGIMKILSLTQKVDIASLSNDSSTSLFNKIKNKFIDNKVRVLGQFNSVSTQIEQISTKLKSDIVEFYKERDWLELMYDENLKDKEELEFLIEQIKSALEYAEGHLSTLKNSENPTEDIPKYNTYVDALSRQLETLTKLAQVSRLTAPEIASMQKTCALNIEKYEDICNFTIPLWKKKMSLGLTSNKQRKAIATANEFTDFTNKMYVETAKMAGANMVEAQKASQRGVLDVESIQEAQDILLSAIKETIASEKKGREDRKNTVLVLDKMKDDLKSTLQSL